MGNASSKGGGGHGSQGPVIVAEALNPLPRYGSICSVLGGVNTREHMLLKVSSSGMGVGKYTLKDVKAAAHSPNGKDNKVALKSDTKSTRKRTTTLITSGSGQELLKIDGTHECIGFRRGAIVSSMGTQNQEDGFYMIPTAGHESLAVGQSSTSLRAPMSSSSLPTSASSSTGGRSSSASDLAFTARALDVDFYSWSVDVRSFTVSPAIPSSPASREHRSVSIYVEENLSLQTVDFTHDGNVVARVATEPGASILCEGNHYPVGKHGIAMVVAPGMDWVLVAAMTFLILTRKADHDVGLATRAGDAKLIKGRLEPMGKSSDGETYTTSSTQSSGGTSGPFTSPSGSSTSPDTSRKLVAAVHPDAKRQNRPSQLQAQ
ncbi:unnamed protein product [Jaminaea pallidilutea]